MPSESDAGVRVLPRSRRDRYASRAPLGRWRHRSEPAGDGDQTAGELRVVALAQIQIFLVQRDLMSRPAISVSVLSDDARQQIHEFQTIFVIHFYVFHGPEAKAKAVQNP